MRTESTIPGDDRPTERRAGPRHAVLFRTVLIDSEIEGEAAEIVNMGSHGFLARTALQRDNGSAVRVTLPVAGEQEAMVVWCGKGMLGGRFAKPVSDETLSELLQAYPDLSSATAPSRSNR